MKNNIYPTDKTNRTKKIIIILLVVFLIIFFLLPMCITYFTHQYHFGKRIVHENNYYEYLTEANPEFIKHDVNFTSDAGQVLNGGFFYQDGLTQPKAIITWVHGMGVNYENYLGEIQYFTKEGYLVFTYNNTGVDTSEGDDLNGLIQAPIDLQHALTYLYDLNLFNHIPNILIGHSWGGFSVAAVSQLDIPRPVDGIVTLAGFWKNINVIEDIAKYYVGDIITLLVPYLTLYEQYIFGENANLNGVDGLNNTTCPVLIIHSEDDVIVSHKSNFIYYKNLFEQDARFTFLSLTDAGHKLTMTKSAYDRIHDIMHHQMEFTEDDPHYIQLDEERQSLLHDYNYHVMDAISSFLTDVTDNYN